MNAISSFLRPTPDSHPIRRGPSRAFLVLAVHLGLTIPAFAFRLADGDEAPTAAPPFVHWDLREFDDCTVPYAINAGGTADIDADGEKAEIEKGFEQWGNVWPALLTFDRRPDTATATVARDGQNVLFWDNDLFNGDAWDVDLSTAIALTVTVFNNATGAIIESDIVFDDQHFDWRTDRQAMGNVVLGDDEYFAPWNAIHAGANGVCETKAVRDDIQVAPVGANVGAFARCVRPGPNGRVDSISNLSGEADVWAVAAHEIGHFCGLGHSDEGGAGPGTGGEAIETLANEPFSTFPGGTLEFTVNGVPVTALFEGGGSLTAAEVAAVVQAAVDAQAPGAATATATSYGTIRVQATNPNHVVIATGGFHAALFALPLGESGISTMNTNSPRGFVSLDQRTLARDDVNGLNFLYSPDLGSADAFSMADNRYQSYVHSNVNSRQLNGVQLHRPNTGALHLFGTGRFEWLGFGVDGNPAECEFLGTTLDFYDDGVDILDSSGSYFAPFLWREEPVIIKVTLSHTNEPGRYSVAAPRKQLCLNGYIDLDGNQKFDISDLVLWWRGTPGATVSQSPNFTRATFQPNSILLEFEVDLPFTFEGWYDIWSRFRLDYGEDEGRIANVSGSLRSAEGAAQFGEVEDYPLWAFGIAPTPTPTETPTPTAPPPPTRTPTPPPTDTPTPTESPTPTSSPTDSPTPTDSPIPTESLTPTVSLTPSPSPTASASPTVSLTPTASATPTQSLTPTPTPRIVRGGLTNFDVLNFTGGPVNDLELVMIGVSLGDIVDYFKGGWGVPTGKMEGTWLEWKGPSSVPPGGKRHFGINLKQNGAQPTSMVVIWTRDGIPVTESIVPLHVTTTFNGALRNALSSPSFNSSFFQVLRASTQVPSMSLDRMVFENPTLAEASWRDYSPANLEPGQSAQLLPFFPNPTAGMFFHSLLFESGPSGHGLTAAVLEQFPPQPNIFTAPAVYQGKLVNFDLFNNTDGPVNDLHIFLVGVKPSDIAGYYTGGWGPPGVVVPAVKLLWKGLDLAPGFYRHFGVHFRAGAPKAIGRQLTWTRDGKPVGSVPFPSKWWESTPTSGGAGRALLENGGASGDATAIPFTLFGGELSELVTVRWRTANGPFIGIDDLNRGNPAVDELPWSADDSPFHGGASPTLLGPSDPVDVPAAPSLGEALAGGSPPGYVPPPAFVRLDLTRPTTDTTILFHQRITRPNDDSTTPLASITTQLDPTSPDRFVSSFFDIFVDLALPGDGAKLFVDGLPGGGVDDTFCSFGEAPRIDAGLVLSFERPAWGTPEDPDAAFAVSLAPEAEPRLIDATLTGGGTRLYGVPVAWPFWTSTGNSAAQCVLRLPEACGPSIQVTRFTAVAVSAISLSDLEPSNPAVSGLVWTPVAGDPVAVDPRVDVALPADLSLPPGSSALLLRYDAESLDGTALFSVVSQAVFDSADPPQPISEDTSIAFEAAIPQTPNGLELAFENAVYADVFATGQPGWFLGAQLRPCASLTWTVAGPESPGPLPRRFGIRHSSSLYPDAFARHLFAGPNGEAWPEVPMPWPRLLDQVDRVQALTAMPSVCGGAVRYTRSWTFVDPPLALADLALVEPGNPIADGLRPVGGSNSAGGSVVVDGANTSAFVQYEVYRQEWPDPILLFTDEIATTPTIPTPTETPAPSRTPPPSPTPSSTPSPTPSSTPSPSATATESPTESPSVSPTIPETATAGPTESPTPSPTATTSPTPTVSETATPPPTVTAIPTATATATPGPSPTPTATPAPSATPTPSGTPTPSATPTLQPTPEPTVDSDGDGWADWFELLVGSSPNDPADSPKIHDLNGDGRVMTLDAILLYRAILTGRPLSLPPGVSPADLDLNGDGRLDVDDALILFRWATGQAGYTVLPLPGD